MGLFSRKLFRSLLLFSTGFTSLTVLPLFSLSITFFIWWSELFLWYGWPAKGVWPYFQLGSLSEILTMQISNTPRAGFEPAQNLSSGLVEWSCAVVITIFDSISSNIDEVLSINSSTNIFIFEGFNIHHKDWLNYSGRTDGPGEVCYHFSISNDLVQMVNFPNQIPDCSHSPVLLHLLWC